MKVFKYICASIIFALSGYCAYNCIGKICHLPYIAFILTFSIGMIVVADGGIEKKRNRGYPTNK